YTGNDSKFAGSRVWKLAIVVTGNDSEYAGNDTLVVSIATGQSLDYESANQYVVNMTASDVSDTSDWALLTVLVADVNESPVLLKHDYTVTQNEGVAGTSFSAPVMSVTDPDTSDSLTYSMDSSSHTSCSYIAVNSTTGIMKYDANYDVDDTNLTQLFTCLIKVEDSGGLSVTATVTVSIEDVNYNNPTFVSNSYVFTVSQTASVGTSIGVVSATDGDVSGAYNSLYYYIESSSYRLYIGQHWCRHSSGQRQQCGRGDNLDVHPLLSFLAARAGGLQVNNTGYNIRDAATMYVTVVGSDNNADFWDKDANVAWVTPTIVAAVGLMAAGGYMAVKHWPGAGRKLNTNHIQKVRPVEKARRPGPTPRPQHIHDKQSPPRGNSRTVTPTDVNLDPPPRYTWEAWGNTDSMWTGSSSHSTTGNLNSTSGWEPWSGRNMAPTDTTLNTGYTWNP
ncbi:hypothetical protein BaRGS_00033548, partial [Batillaria attramentaria]